MRSLNVSSCETSLKKSSLQSITASHPLPSSSILSNVPIPKFSSQDFNQSKILPWKIIKAYPILIGDSYGDLFYRIEGSRIGDISIVTLLKKRSVNTSVWTKFSREIRNNLLKTHQE